MAEMNTATVKTSQKMDFDLLNFAGLRIRVAGPEDIEEWSYGEVLKPETINYRTQKPERDGLFDEKIFGPTKDYECYCGKYKRIRYKGVICDKCGVEVTRSSVRRERMGHIDLAVPVAQIWYVRGVPYILSTILDMTLNDLEKVIYFASFVVTDVNEDLKAKTLEELEGEFKIAKGTLKDAPEQLAILESNYKLIRSDVANLQPRQVLSEGKFQELSMRFGNIMKVGIGAEAILNLLKKIDVDADIAAIKELAKEAHPNAYRRLMKRLRVMTDMKLAGVKPDWLIITKLPVLPPDLRPMVQLDGGRFASSDLNDLYRRVINRNNRLRRLLNQGSPDVITRNEKRMLQEAVDALIDNSARKGQTISAGRQPRSLSDMLRGKQGRFRQNLLGKRVDYSGRSVIVVGPDLKLNQCGLPKVMALELFKPFVISRLINEGYVHNVKNASRLIERGTPEVWEILESITKEAYVLLNRAPTLHRLGIQAFQPVLIEGKAIQVHPLVCSAYNADFDGDQMAVHVPLSAMAKYEAENIMQSSKNLLKPASGEPVIAPRLDMVFGTYYLTDMVMGNKGEGKIFSSLSEANMAHDQGLIHLQSKVTIRLKGEKIETTVGRAIFNEILPKDYPYINETLNSKKLRNLVRDIYKGYGQDITSKISDDLMALGFKYSEKSGMTMSMADIIVPKNKADLLKQADIELEEITKKYRRGLITDDERHRLTIDMWSRITKMAEKELENTFDQSNPLWVMVSSGARGSKNQLNQLAGIKGSVVNPSGDIIEVPITSNYKEGLSVLEYFISTHGSRKGISDTSLKTADAGYLTRRLVDVAQDVVVTEEDCGTSGFISIREEDSESYGDSYNERLLGRVTHEAIKSSTGKVIVKKNQEINEDMANDIVKNDIKEVAVRSTLHCISKWGICKMCYGRDLATARMAEIGAASGIVAAQAIGEPGTQLTLKTFHSGGVNVKDITTGLPRVEEIFEARPPHGAAILSEIDGRVIVLEDKEKVKVEIISDEIAEEVYDLVDDYEPSIKNKDQIKAKQAIATAPEKKAIRAGISGKAEIIGRKIRIVAVEPVTARYDITGDTSLLVKTGDKVSKGDQLTEGHIDLNLLLDLKGEKDAQHYIIQEVQQVYSSHGASVNEKHIEIIVRAMFSKVRVVEGGDSTLLAGQIVDKLQVIQINSKLVEMKKKPIQYEQIVLGITRASLNTNSFLAAASFQETTSVLIKAAIKGAIDPLQGLKENVIIGKLIPAGTGYATSVMAEDIARDLKSAINIDKEAK